MKLSYGDIYIYQCSCNSWTEFTISQQCKPLTSECAAGRSQQMVTAPPGGLCFLLLWLESRGCGSHLAKTLEIKKKTDRPEMPGFFQMYHKKIPWDIASSYGHISDISDIPMIYHMSGLYFTTVLSPCALRKKHLNSMALKKSLRKSHRWLENPPF